jgi:rhodanese-related sulfurtransferase
MNDCPMNSVLRVAGRAVILAAIGGLIGAGHSWNTKARLAPASAERDVATNPLSANPVLPNQTTTANQGTTTPPPATPASTSLKFEITIAQGFELFQQGKPFFDARHREEFETGHVEGAEFAPSDEFSEHVGGLMKYKDETIVIYCGGGACDASHNLAIRLEQAGFTSLHVMTDGYPAWVKAGHPVAKGK